MPFTGTILTVANVGSPSWDPSLQLHGTIYKPNTTLWPGPRPVIVGTQSGHFQVSGGLTELTKPMQDIAEYTGCVCLKMLVPEADALPPADPHSTWLYGQTVSGIYPRQSDALSIGVLAMRSSNPFGLTLPLTGVVGTFGGSGSATAALVRVLTGTAGADRSDFAVVLSPPTDFSDRNPDSTQTFIDLCKNYADHYGEPDSPTLLAYLLSISPVSLVAGLTFSPKILHYNGDAEVMPLTQQSIFANAIQATAHAANYEPHTNVGRYGGVHSFSMWQIPGVGVVSGYDPSSSQIIQWLNGVVGGGPLTPTPSTVLQRSVRLEPGELVTLYELDLSDIPSAFTGNPGPILHFHGGIDSSDSNVLAFQGNSYTPFPIKAEGFEWNTRGTLPRPSLTVSNISSAVSALLREYGDCVGAKLTMRRTYSAYLDDGVEADPLKEFKPEIFIVERKSAENNTICAFELATAMDAEGILLPRRQVLATACSWLYRGVECGYPAPPNHFAAYPMLGMPIADRLGAPFGPTFTNASIANGENVFDGRTTIGSTTLASTTAAFLLTDEGSVIAASPCFPEGTYIVSRTDISHVVLSQPATETHVGDLTFVMTSRSVLTHGTANFVANDYGLYVSSPKNAPVAIRFGTRILGVLSTTQVLLDAAGLITGGGIDFVIGRLNGRDTTGSMWPPVQYLPWSFIDGSSVGSSSNVFASPTANFGAGDVGKTITGDNIPPSTTIASVVNPQTIHLSNNATAAGTNLRFTIANRITYAQHDAVYVMVKGVRVYAVSKVNGNANHPIYDENFWMLDTCLKKLNDCRWHFGAFARLPFGGFPSAARIS